MTNGHVISGMTYKILSEEIQYHHMSLLAWHMHLIIIQSLLKATVVYQYLTCFGHHHHHTTPQMIG